MPSHSRLRPLAVRASPSRGFYSARLRGPTNAALDPLTPSGAIARCRSSGNSQSACRTSPTRRARSGQRLLCSGRTGVNLFPDRLGLARQRQREILPEGAQRFRASARSAIQRNSPGKQLTDVVFASSLTTTSVNCFPWEERREQRWDEPRADGGEDFSGHRPMEIRKEVHGRAAGATHVLSPIHLTIAPWHSAAICSHLTPMPTLRSLQETRPEARTSTV